MKLAEYIRDTDRRRRLAEKVGCNPGYLWQVATQWRGRRPSRILALAIERATGGQVRAADLRPDITSPPCARSTPPPESARNCPPDGESGGPF